MTCEAQAKISSSRSGEGHPVVVFVLRYLCCWSLGRFLRCHHFLPSLLGRHAFPRGGDLEGLRCCMHCPMNYSGYVRVQSLLKCTISSCRSVLASVALDHLSGGCVAPESGHTVLAGVALDHLPGGCEAPESGDPFG
jgi:hypothetical protein